MNGRARCDTEMAGQEAGRPAIPAASPGGGGGGGLGGGLGGLGGGEGSGLHSSGSGLCAQNSSSVPTTQVRPPHRGTSLVPAGSMAKPTM